MGLSGKLGREREETLGRILIDVTGFEVADFSVDVPAGKFAASVRKHDAPVMGMSCLLALAYDPTLELSQAIHGLATLVSAGVMKNVLRNSGSTSRPGAGRPRRPSNAAETGTAAQ